MYGGIKLNANVSEVIHEWRRVPNPEREAQIRARAQEFANVRDAMETLVTKHAEETNELRSGIRALNIWLESERNRVRVACPHFLGLTSNECLACGVWVAVRTLENTAEFR